MGFLVFGVFGEREGVVGGGAAEGDESRVAYVFAELGGGGRGGGGCWGSWGGGGEEACGGGGGGGGGGERFEVVERRVGAFESESSEHFENLMRVSKWGLAVVQGSDKCERNL